MSNKVDSVVFYSKYPHIKPRVETLWGTEAGRTFISELLAAMNDEDSRSSRQGFPPEDAAFLFQLLCLHDDTFPAFNPANKSPIIKRAPDIRANLRATASRKKKESSINFVKLFGVVVLCLVVMSVIKIVSPSLF